MSCSTYRRAASRAKRRPSNISSLAFHNLISILLKAFDFLLNRDTRPHQDDSSVMLLEDDMQYLVQRFVVTLLFYATGGRDTTTHNETNTSKIMEAGKEVGSENDGAGIMTKSIRSGGGGGGWESSTAHFLTGLHECHWVKKSLEDQLWSMLSIDKDKDRRVGVTKCNANMEVTEICLGAYIHQSGLNIEHTNNGTDTQSLTFSCVNTICIAFQ